MQRIKCTISYDGCGFNGYQVQPEKRTVQLELERVLSTMHKRDVKVVASGRTDTGVHAYGQVIHFDSHLDIPPERWIKAMNAMLPEDIAVHQVELVESDFHARFNPKGKEYRYIVDLSPIRNPLTRNYRYHHPYPINVERIKEAIPYIIGTHDFSSFCASNTDVKDKVRTIEKAECVLYGNELTFIYRGNGFLYNMVRILTGTLLEVGTGKKEPGDMEEILARRDRGAAGKTAPAQGLYLWEVSY
ncbi:tRNA pseudouridine(38-40) synthase TruA [Bacillus testis]|uniref:tRNA pseudouridine(38-40) synthase TruA n=1 Tax=Bacillus testis TaxID=1622072 RepID=UPI00067F3C98|nr:tRNA pseudouridine(38-40) synthase TruA [Bacillus testis]